MFNEVVLASFQFSFVYFVSPLILERRMLSSPYTKHPKVLYLL